MRNQERSFGERVGRGVIIGIGALGALAAFDALLLFFFLLFAAMLVAPPGPYIGIVMFIAVPLTVAIGSALAWAGYIAYMEPVQERDGDAHRAEGAATNGQHVQV